MPALIFLITCVPEVGGSETKVFSGNLEDILYKFGSKNTNPLKGFVYKRVPHIYKFYVWGGSSWTAIEDPRPN